MKLAVNFVLRSAARTYTPLIAMFALALTAMYPPGGGIGLLAGLAISLLLALHMLVYGAAAARAALPPALARGGLALGLTLALAGTSAPRLLFAQQIAEAGLFLTLVGGTALVLAVLVGRAPTLRDEDW
jgi:hypothetical protein